jgi:membrane protein
MAGRYTAVLQTFGRGLAGTFVKFFEDNGPLLASGLAFILLLFCIPFALLIVMALEIALGDPHRALDALQALLNEFLPLSREAFTENLEMAIENRGLLGILGFSMFFVMSSLIFGTTRTVLNIVFRVPGPSSFLKTAASDVLVMLLTSGLLLLMVALTSLFTLAKGAVARVPHLEALIGPGWVFASDLLGFLFTFALLFLVYRFCPSHCLQRPALFVAAFTSAALFELSKWAYAWYVDLSQKNIVVYGAVGDLFFFFVWIYYVCAVVILGAEIGWIVQQTLQETGEDF